MRSNQPNFIEMIMLSCQVGALTKTRMWVGSVTFPSMGPFKGSLCLTYVKMQTFVYVFSLSIIVMSNASSYLLELNMLTR